MEKTRKTKLRAFGALLLSAALALSALPGAVLAADEDTVATAVKEEYEDFALEDTWNSTCYETIKESWETFPNPLGVGPYNNGNIMGYSNDWAAHAVNGVVNANGRPRTYYIHDMYYGGTQNASITYRTQDESGDNYFANEVDQIWGYNGVSYKNRDNVPAYIKDFSAIQSTGYAIYDIKLEEGSSVEDAYLTIVHLREDMQKYMGTGDYFWSLIGVPLKNYYDTTKSGYQQIAVPLSDFDIENEEVFSVFLDGLNRHTLDRGALSMKAFHGMGILREDSRGVAVYDIDTTDGIETALQESAQYFAYTANQLAIVNVEAPTNLQATTDNNGVTLSWDASATADVTDYQILRNGSVIATVSNTTTYTDTTTAIGRSYKYGVRAVSANYAGVYSAAAETEVTLMVDAVVKEYMDWKTWADVYVGYDSYIGRGNWYYGDASIWNDYKWVTINNQGVYTASIADPDVEGVDFPISDRVCIGNYNETWTDAEFATPPTSDGKLWAFVGPEYNFFNMKSAWELSEDGNRVAVEDDLTEAEYRYQNVPDKYWLDVMDISAYGRYILGKQANGIVLG